MGPQGKQLKFLHVDPYPKTDTAGLWKEEAELCPERRGDIP